MKLSARNQFVGKVIEISEGAVNSVVKVELEGGEVVTSTITCEAVKELGLTIDKDVTAIVKATEVMVMA
ncbi:MAG: TOBE domain-containing protein [Terrisporobacter sp.]